MEEKKSFKLIIETLAAIAAIITVMYLIMLWITPTTRDTTEQFFLWFIGLNIAFILLAMFIQQIYLGVKRVFRKKKKDAA